MIRRAGNIITYLTLVALLLLNGTAHEFLHSFAAHEDTVDIAHSHQPGDVFFDTEHHHCDFLDLALVAFDHVIPGYNFTPRLIHSVNYAVFYQGRTAHGKIYLRSDRGPPAIPPYA